MGTQPLKIVLARAVGAVLLIFAVFVATALPDLLVQWRHAEGYRLIEVEVLTAQSRGTHTVQLALPDGEEIVYDSSPFFGMPKGARVKAWYNPDAYVDLSVVSIVDERVLTDRRNGPPAGGERVAKLPLVVAGFAAVGGFLAFRNLPRAGNARGTPH